MNIRCKFGNVNACVMMHTDDIILLAPVRSVMPKLLNEWEKYSKDFCLTSNTNKSETIIFGSKLGKFQLYFNNKCIPFLN